LSCTDPNTPAILYGLVNSFVVICCLPVHLLSRSISIFFLKAVICCSGIIFVLQK
jgi:hypothetical protein